MALFYTIKKNCSRPIRFCWPFALGPTPSPSAKIAAWPPARVGHVDNVDNQFQVARPRSPKPCALPGVDNVDNCFLLVHMIHKAFCFAPVRIEAWTFVDKVDNVDARFKLVADEVSA